MAKKKKEDKPDKPDEIKVGSTESPMDYGIGDKTLEEVKKKIVTDIEESYERIETEFGTKWDKLGNLYRGIRVKAENMLDWQNNFSSNRAFGVARQAHAYLLDGLYPKQDFYAITPFELLSM